MAIVLDHKLQLPGNLTLLDPLMIGGVSKAFRLLKTWYLHEIETRESMYTIIFTEFNYSVVKYGSM
jgi:hypothetical protein|tara:strand:+ start:173 stop:370 length:198 start_codon:yes stop_codon:yes gene_type:complete